MTRSRLLALLPLFAPIFALGQYPGASAPPKEATRGFRRISIESAKKHLEFLAGPECEGRGTGQRGFQRAADYVAERFKEFGLKPVGANGTYFQPVPFYSTGFIEEGSSLQLGTKTVKAGDDWRMVNLREPVDLTGKVAVLEVANDTVDLAGANLEGAIVFVKAPKPSFLIRSDLSDAKAAAVIFIQPKVPYTPPIIQRTAPTKPRKIFPAGTISEAVAKDLLANIKMSPLATTSKNGPKKAEISEETVHLIGKAQSQEVGVPNVVGLLEGTDPTLKAELVGIGAHLDHLGISGSNVYPGADDDGSGSTALLEVAAAFKANRTKPRRSILFMAFCGEEMGLIGSGYYSDNPIFPHANMVAELQMDMVGRDSDGIQNGDPKRVEVAAENVDTIRLVGSKRISTELDKLIQDMNRYVGFRFKYDAEDVYTRSDHYNFARQGIPIAFLFDGFHPDYHQPTDTVEKINFEKLTNAAKLYFLTALELANRDARPAKDVVEKN